MIAVRLYSVARHELTFFLSRALGRSHCTSVTIGAFASSGVASIGALLHQQRDRNRDERDEHRLGHWRSLEIQHVGV